MKNTFKWRMIAFIKAIFIAAIMFSMIACSEHESSLSGNENRGGISYAGDSIAGDNNAGGNIINDYKDGDNKNKDDVQGINTDQLVKFTIANLDGKTGTVGLTVTCVGWNWTVEDFTLILDGQAQMYLSVKYGNYNIMLWFEKENTYYVYTGGTNISGINDAQLYEITDSNTINFDQFRIISKPFHELTITGFEYWFNSMQVWGQIFDGDDYIGLIFGTITNGTLKSPIRRFFNNRTKEGSFRLKLQIWQGNYVYELSDFSPVVGSAAGFSSVCISEFVSNYHKLTVTGLKELAGKEVSAAVYNDTGQKLNTQMGFGIISGNTGTFTLAGNFGWNDGSSLKLVLNIKGDLRMYEFSDFTPAGLSTAIDISQFKRNYHRLNFSGLGELLTGGLLYGRRVLVSVYDTNGLEAAHQSYFFQAENNIFSYILLGDFGWTEGSVSPRPFRLRLEFLNAELADLVYELSDFIPIDYSTDLDINHFTQISS